jgi:hypothetical protein
MKKIKSHYPRRRAMLDSPFLPLSDDAFRQFVASGAATPGRQGNALIVTKWRDGPGLGVDAFLESLHAEGSTLEVRDFRSDVNIRVVRATRPTPAVGAGAGAVKRGKSKQ